MLSPLLAHIAPKAKPELRAIAAAQAWAVMPAAADCGDGRHVNSEWWYWDGAWSCRPCRPCSLCGALDTRQPPPPRRRRRRRR